MRFATAEWDDDLPGFAVDPTRYLERLPGLRAGLPPGAWRFAADPGHYDFTGPRCVKDLEVDRLVFAGRDATELEIRFAPNEWKHPSGLTIRYEGVTTVVVHSDRITSASPPGLGGVLLDEILPAGPGCSHEIALTNGSIRIECADLAANWG